jgi:hypothetical protein
MLVADYIAISVLIVLALWAGVELSFPQSSSRPCDGVKR